MPRAPSRLTNARTRWGSAKRDGSLMLNAKLLHYPLPVVDYVTPEKFAEYGRIAEEMGFIHVASGPLVRSSYHADEFEVAK